MNESASAAAHEPTDAAVTAMPASAGAMLRQARVAQGLHIAALAVLLKVPVKKLEALEADRFDLLPDLVFVRALAASVCRTLKIDAVPVLDNLPNTVSPQLRTDGSGINVPFRASAVGAGISLKDQLSRPFVLAALTLMVGVVVLLMLPFSPRSELAQGPKPERPATAALASMPQPSTVEDRVALEPVASAPTSVTLAASDVLPQARLLAQASTASNPSPASAPVALPMMQSNPVAGLLVIKGRGVSWVEVVDADKVVLLRKTIANGEVVGTSGATPLSVVLGRADAIEVQVRGKVFDVAAVAKNNVARFEVR